MKLSSTAIKCFCSDLKHKISHFKIYISLLTTVVVLFSITFLINFHFSIDISSVFFNNHNTSFNSSNFFNNYSANFNDDLFNEMPIITILSTIVTVLGMILAIVFSITLVIIQYYSEKRTALW